MCERGERREREGGREGGRETERYIYKKALTGYYCSLHRGRGFRCTAAMLMRSRLSTAVLKPNHTMLTPPMWHQIYAMIAYEVV